MLDNLEPLSKKVGPFLTEVGQKVRALDEAKKLYGHFIAPDFYIFDYLRTDEMGVSRCVADLLNPRGKHGQGNVFLKQFLKALDTALLANLESNEEGSNVPKALPQWSMVPSENCEVRLEHGIDNQRRIDLYLTLSTGEIIGIENKPWAGDQHNQLNDYAKFIEKEACNNQWLLIYLCNRDASEFSIDNETRNRLSAQGKLLTLNFSFLIDWLSASIAEVKAPSVRFFIEEFAKYIRRDINGDIEMSVKNEVKKIILDNNFESAILVSKTINEVKKELISKLHIDISAATLEKGYTLEWKKSMDSAWSRYAGFGINFSDKSEYDIELWFEFDSSNLNQFYWGLRRKNETIKNENGRWESLNQLMVDKFGKGSHSLWWLWSAYEAEDGYKNWDSSAEPWISIQNGNLVKKIMARAEDLHQYLQDANKLSLLKI